jgi:HNH endonuclease
VSEDLRCMYCGGPDPKHLDHVVPLSRGGPDGPENRLISCQSCNLRKSDRTPSEWLGRDAPLLALDIERRILAKLEMGSRARRGRRPARPVTVDNHSSPEDYYRNNPFERRLSTLNDAGITGHTDDAVHVHDSLETASAIAKSIFGDAATPERTFDVYRVLEQQRRWRVINDRSEAEAESEEDGLDG